MHSESRCFILLIMNGFFPPSSETEKGNALWFILVAIVLLGALTVLLTRGGNTVDQSGDVEQQRIRSGQLLRWAKGVEAAIEQMKLRGISENDISFENDETTADYTNPNCSINDCRVFAAGGGGQTYLKPPSGANDGSDWIFTGANNVGTINYPIGTTALKTGNDLVILLPNANPAMCNQANKDLDINGVPDDASGIDLTPFVGVYDDSALVTIDGDPSPYELDGKPSGCFIDTNANPDVVYFYYVVLAR
jgi:hypothetical protein